MVYAKAPAEKITIYEMHGHISDRQNIGERLCVTYELYIVRITTACLFSYCSEEKKRFYFSDIQINTEKRDSVYKTPPREY